MTATNTNVLLKKGMQGASVKQLQVKLNRWIKDIDIVPGGSILVEDGIFGAATERIVKFFQCRNFLFIDGIVGNQTMDCLNRGIASLPTLKLGSKGAIVQRLQQVLELYGIELGVVDGIYGAKTRAAVMRFQNDYHIFDVNGHATGEVNFNTWSYLIQEPAAMACGPLKSFS